MKLIKKIITFMKAVLDILHRWCNTLHHKYKSGVYTFIATEPTFTASANFHYPQTGPEYEVPDNVEFDWEGEDTQETGEYHADWLETPNVTEIIGDDYPIKLGTQVDVRYKKVISLTINGVNVV